MRYLGPYGEMAEKHMQRWQPNAYASIPLMEQESYFQELNEAVAEAIRCRERPSRPPASMAQHNHQDYVAQINMAHLMAEEAVLAEMVLLPPEPGLASRGEPETDSTGAYQDEGWRSPSQELSDDEWQDRRTEKAWKPAVVTKAQEPPQERPTG